MPSGIENKHEQQENSNGDLVDSRSEQKERSRKNKRKRNRGLIIFSAILLVAAVGGLLYWLHARHFEDTDDAQVDGNLSQISARVAGHIVQVNVEENKTVQQGQILAVIDPRDYVV